MLLDTYVVCVSSQTLPVILYYIIILQPVTEDGVSPKKKRVLDKNNNDHDEKKRPMVVYISDSMNHHIASYEYRDTNEDNDNISTLDGEYDENKTESSGDDDDIYSEGISHTAGEENHSCPDNDKGGDKSNEDLNKDVTSSTISSKS